MLRAFVQPACFAGETDDYKLPAAVQKKPAAAEWPGMSRWCVIFAMTVQSGRLRKNPSRFQQLHLPAKPHSYPIYYLLRYSFNKASCVTDL